jgi:hypothetical protein
MVPTTDDLSPRQLTTYWQLGKVCHHHTLYVVYTDMVFPGFIASPFTIRYDIDYGRF